MWARVCLAAVCLTTIVVAGCNSAQPQPGAPCTPSLDNCPMGQQCAAVEGGMFCVNGPVDVDDASLLADATIDAPIDVTTDDAPPIEPPPQAWSLVQTNGNSNAELDVVSDTLAGNLIIVAVQTSTQPRPGSRTTPATLTCSLQTRARYTRTRASPSRSGTRRTRLPARRRSRRPRRPSTRW